tara:strand:+ start:44 stop:562 length:519 start_codon:yes stop_codon:yes gene_type:complete
MIFELLTWLKAVGIVSLPFIKMFSLWICYQMGIGYIAWATARFYSTNCAGPGISGFVSSLFTMGSPICISAWISHAAFVTIYVTAFIAAVVFGIMWFWKKFNNDKTIQNLKLELNNLKQKFDYKSPSQIQKKEIYKNIDKHFSSYHTVNAPAADTQKTEFKSGNNKDKIYSL